MKIKRNHTANEDEPESSRRRLNESQESQAGVDGNHQAWQVIIGKLDFYSQWKLSQQNKYLADIVNLNAESELRKFQRKIRENKYM